MNKKLLAIAFTAVLAIGVVGCSSNSSSSAPASGGGSSAPASSPAASEPASATSSETSASVGIPNPWSEAASAAEAAEAAGLKGFSVPDAGIGLTIGNLGDWTFSSTDGMAQAKTTAGDVEITIRKAVLAGNGDISGDYNAYEYEWPLTLKGLTVECSGHSEDAANKVLWASSDDAYCILADGAGLSPDDINSLINAIQ